MSPSLVSVMSPSLVSVMSPSLVLVSGMIVGSWFGASVGVTEYDGELSVGAGRGQMILSTHGRVLGFGDTNGPRIRMRDCSYPYDQLSHPRGRENFFRNRPLDYLEVLASVPPLSDSTLVRNGIDKLFEYSPNDNAHYSISGGRMGMSTATTRDGVSRL